MDEALSSPLEISISLVTLMPGPFPVSGVDGDLCSGVTEASEPIIS
jgi:hypothetical protein